MQDFYHQHYPPPLWLQGYDLGQPITYVQATPGAEGFLFAIRSSILVQLCRSLLPHISEFETNRGCLALQAGIWVFRALGLLESGNKSSMIILSTWVLNCLQFSGLRPRLEGLPPKTVGKWGHGQSLWPASQGLFWRSFAFWLKVYSAGPATQTSNAPSTGQRFICM